MRCPRHVTNEDCSNKKLTITYYIATHKQEKQEKQAKVVASNEIVDYDVAYPYCICERRLHLVSFANRNSIAPVYTRDDQAKCDSPALLFIPATAKHF
jgi:hypothetical protein